MPHDKQLTFDPNLHDKLKPAFKKAWEGFPDLHHHTIKVQHKDLKRTSMRAQPLIDQKIFNRGHRSYKIELNQNLTFQDGRKLFQLPQAVLIGWFAHELGHIKDYQHRSGWGLFKLGIAYTLLPTYRIGVERKADLLALEKGFGPYLESTKKFLLHEGNVDPAYLGRLKKYYLSIEEIKSLMAQKDPASEIPTSLH